MRKIIRTQKNGYKNFWKFPRIEYFSIIFFSVLRKDDKLGNFVLISSKIRHYSLSPINPPNTHTTRWWFEIFSRTLQDTGVS